MIRTEKMREIWYVRQSLRPEKILISWRPMQRVLSVPVSYTHLDVYKRQLQNLAAVISTRTNIARMNEILDHPIQQGSDRLSNQGYDIVFDHVGFEMCIRDRKCPTNFTRRLWKIACLSEKKEPRSYPARSCLFCLWMCRQPTIRSYTKYWWFRQFR